MELGPYGEWLYVFGKPGSLGIYRVSTDRWSLVSGGPPNGKGCMTSKGTNSVGEPVIFIFGGKDINGNEMNQTYQYNLYGGELTQRGNMPQPIVNGATAKISAAPPSLLKIINVNFLQGFDQTLLVFGGVTNGVVTNDEFTFSTETKPDVVTAIATADTIRADSVRILWNSASPIEATYYEVLIASDIDMNNIVADSVVADTTTIVAGLQEQSDHYWQVRAYNAGGWGDYNAPLHFFADFISTGMNLGNENLPSQFKLYQNYPNPFNPVTTIEYSVIEQSHVELRVYDIIGQEIATLVNEVKHPGDYSFVFSKNNIPSGIYFYRLKMNNFVEMKKMILLR